jgi:hypothetical protein
MRDHRAVLSPDPEPRQVARPDGAAELLPEASKPAPVIRSATPGRNSTTATDLAEEVKLLRAQLHTLAATLHSLADRIGHDTEAAEAQARIDADMRRRF